MMIGMVGLMTKGIGAFQLCGRCASPAPAAHSLLHFSRVSRSRSSGPFLLTCAAKSSRKIRDAAFGNLEQAPSISGILMLSIALIWTGLTLLLTAIAKARGWIDDLVEGRATCFAEIAAREGKIERHIRNLAALSLTMPAARPKSTSASSTATRTNQLSIAELHRMSLRSQGPESPGAR